MLRRRSYTEIQTPERVNVQHFLSNALSYDCLIKIPFDNLNAVNKKIYEALCDPLSMIELDEEFRKFSRNYQSEKSKFSLFFTSCFDDNDKFEYYFMQLKDDYDAWSKKTEKMPLI